MDDRSVLAILDALQVLTFREGGVAEARRLSYRSLDVEQIGHVYEGLLDHGAVKVDDLAVGLRGSTSDGPELAVELLEDAAAKGHAALVKYLVQETGRTTAQIEKGLAVQPAADLMGRLRSACEHDDGHVGRVLPFVGLLEEDLRGLPMVFMPGSVYVTATTERRDTGTQYTPKDLADEIVRYALEPLVYAPGPAEGADAADWRIRPPEEILALRVCDPAVGSGAILVAACRFLSERLIEAARVHEPTSGDAARLLSPDDPDVALVARRLVVDHCLYGVDRNPLAAEMAKLSLWLVTLAKERPFTFLDHAIRVGDSLLGITSLDQVRYLHLDPDRGRQLHRNLLAVTEAIEPLVAEALVWIRAMREIDPVTVADVEDQRAMSLEAERALGRVGMIADAILGKALAATRAGQQSLDDRLSVLSAVLARALDPRRSQPERDSLLSSISDDAQFDLNVDRPYGAPERSPLHWPLAFPEVFAGARGGFHAVVGNPPFVGGQRITGTAGEDYREYLVSFLAGGRRGSADLVAYFFLRAASILESVGTFGFFATNTISQGETRQVGLDQLTAQGWVIYRAEKSRRWPGSANVAISQVWLRRSWSAAAVLDGQSVQGVDSGLDTASQVAGKPFRLVAYQGVSFQGSIVLGMGFILDHSEAAELIGRDPRNQDVISPLVSGDDVSKSPSQMASRSVINFYDWPEEHARTYPLCWAIVEERVRPERQRRGPDGEYVLRRPLPERFWMYGEKRPALYGRVANFHRVLVIVGHSKMFLPVFVPTGVVWSHALFVFAYDDDFHFGVLTSAFHGWWTVKYASTLESRIRYTPTDVFETFPQPEFSDLIRQAGQGLDAYRRDLMITRDEGLTKTYNRLHNPAEQAIDIQRLRDLHVALDVAVADAYGWGELELNHGFHETRLGVRFTVGPQAQTEILDRLLELNHARYARERAELATGAKPVRKRQRSSPGQTSMLGED